MGSSITTLKACCEATLNVFFNKKIDDDKTFSFLWLIFGVKLTLNHLTCKNCLKKGVFP